MALNLVRLHALTHEAAYRDQAEAVLGAFAGSAARLTTSAATYMRAVDWFSGAVTSVVVVGSGEPDNDALLRAALAYYRPRTVIRYFTAGKVSTDELPPELRAMVTSVAPRAYVCAGQTCAAPVSDAEVLRELLGSFKG